MRAIQEVAPWAQTVEAEAAVRADAHGAHAPHRVARGDERSGRLAARQNEHAPLEAAGLLDLDRESLRAACGVDVERSEVGARHSVDGDGQRVARALAGVQLEAAAGVALGLVDRYRQDLAGKV